MQALPVIPVLDTGSDFAMATLVAEEKRAHALMDAATGFVPRAVLRGLDVVSRRWLERHRNSHLDEIEAIAKRLGRPGAIFLAVNYEWGCTVAVGPSPDGNSARLLRTLDWGTPGLGRYVMAAKVSAVAGPFVTLTWPGFTGVLQAVAPGRFSAALNQAPMRRLGGGVMPLDWMANRRRVWNMPHQTASHLLRTVMERARDFAEARSVLSREPIAAPATFTLAGLAAEDTCVIERSETRAHVIDGKACATNHWRGLDHGARPRGFDSPGRYLAMCQVPALELDTSFAWLKPPVLNPVTRLAMVADAKAGRLVAQGYEQEQPATRPLVWSMAQSAEHQGFTDAEI